MKSQSDLNMHKGFERTPDSFLLGMFFGARRKSVRFNELDLHFTDNRPTISPRFQRYPPVFTSQ